MDLGGLIADVPVGGYINLWKLIPLLILVLIWARLLTWIDKDAPSVFLPRTPINAGMVAGMILALVLFFMLPGMLIALTVLVFFLLAEIGTYLLLRKQKVGLGDLQLQFKNWVGSFGGKGKEVEAPPGDVLLMDRSGAPIAAPKAEDPERAAYDAVQTFFTEPLRRFAEQIHLAPSEAGYSVRYVVDGVAYNGANLEKTSAAAAIQYLKPLAGLDINEKRKPQSGTMKLTVDAKRRELSIETRGSAAGEQLLADVDAKNRHSKKLEELGLDEKQIQTIRDVIAEGTGVVLVASPKGQGLTSTVYGILRAHDAFLSHVQTLEPDPDLDLEGITQNALTANPAEDLRQIEWVISQEPDVILATRVHDSRAAIALAKFGASRLCYIGIRAGSTFDALSEWRKLVGDDRLAMKNLRLIIAGRVMRKLCTACKVGYTPDPTTLRRLNMDPDRVSKLYQARTTPLRDPKGNPIPCEFCRELQYRGRTGVYETFLIDDDVRNTVEQGGSSNQLKSLFRKQRGKYLQEQALTRVEAGDTSVQEVLRIMKIGESSGGSGRGSAPPSRGGQPPRQPRQPTS